jgi:tetratricopeptide (TPR) repeat protein
MKLVFFLLLFSFTVYKTYSQTIKTLEFIPRSSVVNSSCLAGDTEATLLNPAGLYSLERFNFELASYGLTISFAGVAFPVANILGNFAFGIYNYQAGISKAGYFIGFGQDFYNVLGFGISVKTMSPTLTNNIDGILFDSGIIFHPNESLGLDIFKNEFFNNRLFLSFGIQNAGKSPNYTVENLALRTGFAYDFSIIGTKFFIDKSFLSAEDIFIVGVDFIPPLNSLKFLQLSFSYDIDRDEIKAGGGFLFDDFKIHFSYSFNSKLFYAGINGYFGKTRSVLSIEYYEKALKKYEEGQKIENRDIESAFEIYQKSYDDLLKSLSYDGENKKALLLKQELDEKTTSYKSNFLTLAQKSENEQNQLQAFLYYKKLFSIDKGDKMLKSKVDFYSTNENVQKKFEEEKKVMFEYYKKKKYIQAKNKAQFLLEIFPNDMDVKKLSSELNEIIFARAEYYYKIAYQLYKKGDYTSCLDNLTKALAYKSDYEKARDLYNLVTNEISKKKSLERAKQEYTSGNYIIAYRLVNAYLEKNPDSKEAISLKNNILKNMKQSIDKTLEEGIAYYNKGEYEKAIEELDKVLLVDTNNSVAKDYKNRAVSKLKALKKLEEFSEE